MYLVKHKWRIIFYDDRQVYYSTDGDENDGYRAIVCNVEATQQDPHWRTTFHHCHVNQSDEADLAARKLQTEMK